MGLTGQSYSVILCGREKKVQIWEKSERNFVRIWGEFRTKNSSQHTQKRHLVSACLLSTEYKCGRLSTIISSVPNVEYFSTER